VKYIHPSYYGQGAIEYLKHILGEPQPTCAFIASRLEELADNNEYFIVWDKALRIFVILSEDTLSAGFGVSQDVIWGMYAPDTDQAIKKGSIGDILPHGSGIDCDWHIEVLSNGTVSASNGYHAMQEGMYWGYLDFTCYLSVNRAAGQIDLDRVEFNTDYIPSWLGGRQGMLDYLHDTIDAALEDKTLEEV